MIKLTNISFDDLKDFLKTTNPLVRLYLFTTIIFIFLAFIATYKFHFCQYIEHGVLILWLVKIIKLCALIYMTVNAILIYIKLERNHLPKWWTVSFLLTFGWSIIIIIFLFSSINEMNKKFIFYSELRKEFPFLLEVGTAILYFTPVLFWVICNGSLSIQLKRLQAKPHDRQIDGLQKKLKYFVYFVDGPILSILFGIITFVVLMYYLNFGSLYLIQFLNGSTATLIIVSAMVGAIIEEKLSEEELDKVRKLGAKLLGADKDEFLKIVKNPNKVDDDWWKPEKSFFKEIYKNEIEQIPRYLYGRQQLNEAERSKREVDGVCELIEKHLALNSEGISTLDLLDVPCGYGRHLNDFALRFSHVFAVDINENFIKQAKQRLKNDKNLNKVTFEVADMRSLQKCETLYPKMNSIDVITNLWTSFGFFHSKEDDLEVLKHWFSLMKSGGIAIIHFDIHPTQVSTVWKNYNEFKRNPQKETFYIKEVYDTEQKAIWGIWYIDGPDRTILSPTFRINIRNNEEWTTLANKAGFEVLSFEDTISRTDPISGEALEFVVVLQKP